MSAGDTTKYGLHKMWGQCPHVTSVSGVIQPATMKAASCIVTDPGSLVPAQRSGYEVDYFDPLFGGVKTQKFSAEGKPL